MQSKNNPDQFDFVTPSARKPRDFTIGEVVHCANLTEALNKAQEVSGLQDKSIYIPLKIKAAQYSRIMSGENWFPNDNKYLGFLNLTNNDIPTIWAAERRGFDWSTIQRHRSNLEKENERLRGEIAKRDEAIALFVKAGAR